MSDAHPADATKECPLCAETIRAKAVRCRFCGHDLIAQHPPTSPGGGFQPVTQIVNGKPGKNSFQSCMGCAGTALLIFIVLLAIASGSH